MNSQQLEIRVLEIEGHTGWECQNVRALRKNASSRKRAEALDADRNWLVNHTQESEGRFDALIKDLGMEGEV